MCRLSSVGDTVNRLYEGPVLLPLIDVKVVIRTDRRMVWFSCLHPSQPSIVYVPTSSHGATFGP